MSRDLGAARVLLTRSARGCREWAPRVRERGGVPVAFPCIATVAVPDLDTVGARLRKALERADWLALTSPFGAELAAEAVGEALPTGVSIAAVGPVTAERARDGFGRVDLIAAGGTGVALAEDLAEQLAGALAEDPAAAPERATTSLAGPAAPPTRAPSAAEPAAPHLVVAAAVGGRRDLEEVLEPRGAFVSRFELYRTEPAPAQPHRQSLSGTADVVLLASPSAVDGLRRRADLNPDIPIVTIGPTTSAAAEAAGMRVAAQARARTLESMLEAIP